MPISINTALIIPDDELEWSYARSGGPGGQNVNKVESKVILRWKMQESQLLSEAVKLRLRGQFPSAVTLLGEVLIVSQRYRDRPRNIEDCTTKLIAMVKTSLVVPKLRRKTKPTKGSQLRRLDEKKQQSSRKTNRKNVRDDD